MSTTRCESYSFPWIFKDCQERTGQNRGEKITLPGALASVSKFIYVAVKDPHSGSGILTGFPFDRRPEKSSTLKRSFPIS
ncbi:hypothetical protein GGU10DRAFT_279372 [Lentinula aff. detonsa]|uniref:Uncharacterized protein n=2 Tax=Lentinula TaxID=5352 RepID=A0AA38KWJ8_9AGAR|nr:hypothetical protein GGU10DRAFT_279372 [Lentinula aff. detonsa]KAJ3979165.1 hypothetical protein F5890DRAFT_1469586 [Lentinula detonsa]